MSVRELLKSTVDAFVDDPVWKWKSPGGVGRKKQAKWAYLRIVSICRTSQYFLGVFALLFVLSFENSRLLLTYSTFRHGLPLFLLDILTYALLGFLLGWKRLPSNYISLVIIKSFVFLEDKFKPDQYQFNAKVLGPSQMNGQWSVVTAAPKVPSGIVSATLRSTATVFILLAAIWCTIKLYNIDIRRYKGHVLVLQTVTTSLAAVLLLSTFAFEMFPEFKEPHRKLCGIWIGLGVTTLFMTLGFLLESLQLQLTKSGKIKSHFPSRMDWDGFIFILVFSIVVRYIPTVCGGFSVADALSNKTGILFKLLLPANVIEGWNNFTAYLNKLI